METKRYAKRKLWSHKAKLGLEDNFAYEAVYAYSLNYPGAMHPTPGRYRIRISKMPAADFIKSFSEEVDVSSLEEGSLSVTFTMQAFLEKWAAEGWIPCLDWMGDPDSSMDQIEEELNDMFEAFKTGIPRKSVDGEWDPFPFKPAPKKRRTAKPPKPKGPRKPAGGDDDSDFDWI